MIEEVDGRTYQSVYPVMRFMGYDARDDIKIYQRRLLHQ